MQEMALNEPLTTLTCLNSLSGPASIAEELESNACQPVSGEKTRSAPGTLGCFTCFVANKKFRRPGPQEHPQDNTCMLPLHENEEEEEEFRQQPHLERQEPETKATHASFHGKDKDDIMACCYVADDSMAGDGQRAEKNILSVPYSVLLSIYQSLDADKGWERLACEAGYTFDQIRLLELELGRNQGSPGRSLLWELGSRNTTVRQLYGYLNSAGRCREMKSLEDYVNSPVEPSSYDNGLKGLKAKSVDLDSSQSSKGSGSHECKRNNSSTASYSSNLDSQPASDPNNSMKCFSKDKHYPGKHIPVAASGGTTTSFSSPLSAVADSSRDPKSIHIPPVKPPNPNMLGCSALAASRLGQVPNGSGSRLGGEPGRIPSVSDVTSAPCRSSLLPGSKTSSSSSFSDLVSSGLSSLPGLDSSLDIQMGLMGSACFKYSEILQATNNFNEHRKIGEGAFGAVYSATLRQIKCAVKKMFEESTENTVVERSTQVLRELTSLLKFRHENIVTLYGYALEGESLCLVYQYMPNGSLEDRLMCKNGTAPLQWLQRLNILVGACQGLNFLHSVGEQPLIHGDIKSANILLDKHLEAKIGDLGQAQQATSHSADSNTVRHTHITRAQTTTKLYGTRAYQAPELQAGNLPSIKSDVFSMGVVILEVFCGEPAFDERREGDKFLGSYFKNLEQTDGLNACLARLDRRGGECPQDVAGTLIAITKECCSDLKKKRPTAAQLLEKVNSVEQLYREKAERRAAGMDSITGSERSCYESHHSIPPKSVKNMAAAPLCNLQAESAITSYQNTAGINLNRDTQPVVKHFATHLHHESRNNAKGNGLSLKTNLKVDKPINTSADGVNTASSLSPGRPDGLSLESTPRSPLEYFQGKPLPTAFLMQIAYDQQIKNQAERKRIDRLSQCYPVEADVVPASDPAKLSDIEEFDRINLATEVDTNIPPADPKKIAALKQFDQQSTFPSVQNTGRAKLPGGESEEEILACDPEKLAYMTHFDESIFVPGSIVQQTQREEEVALASDPKKLADLMCDQANCVFAAGSPQQRPATCQGSGDGSGYLVSREDFLITSQQEALTACNSLRQPRPQLKQTPQERQSGLLVQQPAVTSPCQLNVPTDPPDCARQNQATSSQLLNRRNDFFNDYLAALDAGSDDNDECDYGEEETESVNCVSVSAGSSVQDWAACRSPRAPVSGSVPPVVSRRSAGEQDESLPDLNYYREREKHFGKVFNKNPQKG